MSLLKEWERIFHNFAITTNPKTGDFFLHNGYVIEKTEKRWQKGL